MELVNHKETDGAVALSGGLSRHDAAAGIVVFLVALPLCLGIALASGAPLFGGIIAGIVGGIVVSIASGSNVSVSGPAAGLAVIVASAIQQAGSYRAFLTAVVLAGGIQLVFGLLRLGAVADYVPNSVIRGMLAGIGLVIILKQIPHALGRDKDYEGDFSFLTSGSSNTLTDIANGVLSASAGAIAISTMSLVILIAWNRLSHSSRFFQIFPGPLVVVLAGIGLNQLFALFAPSLQVTQPEHMVDLPVWSSFSDFLAQITLPDFAAIQSDKVWFAAGTIAVVASLESLLSLEAADKLDPYKRISPPNRELMAQGLGNILSGMVGGLPVTSVVIRTSANVYAGGKTWRSSLLHGILLLLSVVTVPGLLKLIPLSCLSAILIVTGYKLANPALFSKMRSLGWAQFLPFVITVLAVVFSDLLTGVLIGLACGAFFVIRVNHHEAITVVSRSNNYLFRFNKDASFVNKSELRSKLRKLPAGSSVVLDGTRAIFIDHDIMEVVEDFRELARFKNIAIELKHWDTQTL